MTTGSWTVGVNSVNSVLYAEKAWTGADGKTEAWAGGTRLKWNAYQMSHHRWRYTTDPMGDGHPDLPKHTVAQFKSLLGWTSNDDLSLLNKLAEEIKGHAFDLGINMAEAHKSYGMILTNLRSVGSALVAIKHGNPSRAARALGVSRQGRSSQLREAIRGRGLRPLTAKDISGRWLELQYGWRPLLDQAYEAGKALEAATQQRSLRFSASSQRKKLVDLGDGTFYQMWTEAKVRVKIIAELYEDISFARAMGLTNPAAIAWEIVPYSFVVDWFVPVGSYLSAWGVIPALKGRFLTISQGSWKGSRFVKTSPFPLWRPATGYGLQRSRFVIDRVPSTNLSVPAPTFKKVPQALSPAHLKNAVALIHQLLAE